MNERCISFRGPGMIKGEAKVIISKTVTLNERGLAQCPFCQAWTLRVGANLQDEVFYHCFGCDAGGRADIVNTSVGPAVFAHDRREPDASDLRYEGIGDIPPLRKA